MNNQAVNEINVYNIMQQQIAETFSAPEAGAASNDGLEGREYRRTVVGGFMKENRETLFVTGVFILCAIHMFFRIIFYGIGIARIDTAYTTGSLVCCVAATLVPLLNWIYSTKLKSFSIHQRKFMLLRFCIATFAVMMTTYIYHHVGNVLIPLVVTLFKPTVSRSVAMVKMFCRGLMFLVSMIPGISIYVMLSRLTRDEIQQYKIINFDISMSVDLRDRKTKEFAYDLKIAKNLVNGKQYAIKEKDRFLHALDDGATGSGKTSSTFTTALANDFYQRSYNLEHQKMGVEKLVAAGRVRMAAPMDDSDFDIDNFIPLDKKAKAELYDLKYKSPLASIMAIAPNEAFADEIYELAKANGLKVNRVDPMLSSDGRLKEGFIGLNPIYIKPGLTEVQYLIEVNQRAVLFADVMQAVYDKSGQSNPYFSGLNQNITTSVTAMILLCAPYMPEKFADRGLVPTPSDVRDVLNDFTKAREYDKAFLTHYARPGTKYDSHPDFGELQYIYDVVHGRLLGADSSQLFDQCQGLRNIINQLLGNPMICNILCSQHTIDLDRVLAKGEVVVVNYALNLGSDGVTFGLFYLLSLIQAAYRRPAPEKERLPCFICVDELPQLLHPKLEACFALFRQYRMAMFVAIQSLAQLRKSRDTAFLEQVLLGNCAHHFVFGRAGVEDMEIYMALAGTHLEAVLTESRNETSLFSSNPTVSYQHRFTNQRVNNIEGSDIHDLKFQECLLITVNDGTPVAAFKAMVFFLPRWRRTQHKRYECNWGRYYNGSLDGSDESLYSSADSCERQTDPLSGDPLSDPVSDVIMIPRQTISVDHVESENRFRVSMQATAVALQASGSVQNTDCDERDDLLINGSDTNESQTPTATVSDEGSPDGNVDSVSSARDAMNPIATNDAHGSLVAAADSRGFLFSAGAFRPTPDMEDPVSAIVTEPPEISDPDDKEQRGRNTAGGSKKRYEPAAADGSAKENSGRQQHCGEDIPLRKQTDLVSIETETGGFPVPAAVAGNSVEQSDQNRNDHQCALQWSTGIDSEQAGDAFLDANGKQMDDPDAELFYARTDSVPAADVPSADAGIIMDAGRWDAHVGEPTGVPSAERVQTDHKDPVGSRQQEHGIKKQQKNKKGSSGKAHNALGSQDRTLAPTVSFDDTELCGKLDDISGMFDEFF